MYRISSVEINDPVFNKDKELSALDRFFMKYINDQRDLPFIYLNLGLAAWVITFAAILYTPGMFSWWIAVPYLLVNIATLLGRYILMLHNTSHRKLFKKEYDWLNKPIVWFIGPFFGETPDTYYAHHICMHHSEGNLKDDLSSTMKYNRDSFLGFMHYFGTFFFLGIVTLSRYFFIKDRKEWMRRIIIGELSFFAFVVVLSLINFQATLAMFIIPFVFTRFAMMAGNWAQHAFIDQNDPGNSYKNSITCINSPYNKTCFNDGYHIGHHVRPAMHWTDMPGEFQKNLDKYREQEAIVFHTVDFFVVWFFLVTKSYGMLAKFYVDLDDRFENDEQVKVFLKSRTRRVPKELREKYSGMDYMRELRKKKL